MNPIETIMYVALGFALTLVALEMSWRRVFINNIRADQRVKSSYNK
jgi:hypothetical protein